MQERRRHPRYAVRLPVEIEVEGCRFGNRGESADVSLCGFYFATMTPMPIGAKLKIILWLEHESIGCDAIVRTSDPGVGNGIEFVSLDENGRTMLANFLAHLPEPSLIH